MQEGNVVRDRRDRLDALAARTRAGMAEDAAGRADLLASAAAAARAAPETSAANMAEALVGG
jgi:hypothetical protein